jgi:hypothetical protein
MASGTVLASVSVDQVWPSRPDPGSERIRPARVFQVVAKLSFQSFQRMAFRLPTWSK